MITSVADCWLITVTGWLGTITLHGRVYTGEEMGDGAVLRQVAAAGYVIVKGCPQQAHVAPKHLRISHLMPVYLA